MFKSLRSGIWKNTEDQILKAAVMKYGLNQWDRISSLLINKTAKQCKSRWFFYLNPKINRKGWTFDEDERLIYLAFILPSQWNTIAPLIGRTTDQCFDRFQKLINIKTNNTVTKSINLDPRESILKDFNTNLETKIAVKDNIINDYEMQNILVEARARLANTKGKKAIRKAKSLNNYFSNFIQAEKVSSSLLSVKASDTRSKTLFTYYDNLRNKNQKINLRIKQLIKATYKSRPRNTRNIKKLNKNSNLINILMSIESSNITNLSTNKLRCFSNINRKSNLQLHALPSTKFVNITSSKYRQFTMNGNISLFQRKKSLLVKKPFPINKVVQKSLKNMDFSLRIRKNNIILRKLEKFPFFIRLQNYFNKTYHCNKYYDKISIQRQEALHQNVNQTVTRLINAFSHDEVSSNNQTTYSISLNKELHRRNLKSLNTELFTIVIVRNLFSTLLFSILRIKNNIEHKTFHSFYEVFYPFLKNQITFKIQRFVKLLFLFNTVSRLSNLEIHKINKFSKYFNQYYINYIENKNYDLYKS
mmetsp:Transcript_42044/g.67623  ORF Transcript_42044/g.67623 Transcript_42044/m.67623 type:complete len:531 (-) Transcript_42044:321-1913(-)